MKKIILYMLLLSVFSCTEDEVKQQPLTEAEAQYVGTYHKSLNWYKIISLPSAYEHRKGLSIFDLYKDETYHVLILNDDHTYIREVGLGFIFYRTMEGSWKISGDNIVANINGTEKDEVFYIKSFSDGKLTLQFDIDALLIPDVIADTLQYETVKKTEWYQPALVTFETTFEKQ